MNFADLGLSESTIKALNEHGIMTPTTVQTDVIPSVLAGKDVFAIAPSGCGKTCSYVLPLIDIISDKKAKTILIVTAGPQQSVAVSDRFAVFNKYHEINESTITDSGKEADNEADVIIASPDLLADLLRENKIDLSKVDILVVDDINLIKKMHQLDNLKKVLQVLPADKQNIVYTNRRSKETQEILDSILQTPAEVKIDRAKEQEAARQDAAQPVSAPAQPEPKAENKAGAEPQQQTVRPGRTPRQENAAKKNPQPGRDAQPGKDPQALELVKKYHTFGRNTPAFLLTEAKLADDDR